MREMLGIPVRPTAFGKASVGVADVTFPRFLMTSQRRFDGRDQWVKPQRAHVRTEVRTCSAS